jgi:hypothetical protein
MKSVPWEPPQLSLVVSGIRPLPSTTGIKCVAVLPEETTSPLRPPL